MRNPISESFPSRAFRKCSAWTWIAAPVLLAISILVAIQVLTFKPDEFGMGLLACALVLFWLSVAANLSYLGFQLARRIRGRGRQRVSLVKIFLIYTTLLIQVAAVWRFFT